MGVSRYAFTSRLDTNTIASTDINSKIYLACERGIIPCSSLVTKAGQRLDHLAAAAFGDNKLWWIIAAASGIGWPLQVPPGTLIRIPQDLNIVFTLMREG